MHVRGAGMIVGTGLTGSSHTTTTWRISIRDVTSCHATSRLPPHEPHLTAPSQDLIRHHTDISRPL
ncbi:hypothetical protein STRIP9103_04246 [Streptomyces ipomoeae 91-03]|uniref:Uncharacterized protein n=1 Tax=Streptomyces ipomoeae 91-03 TaxID=698759 RepID=L1L8S9_9ACTN|nr:hypothetical protein STRIP9103_04246 [Streptomyces ipomoeae 91-03]